MNYMFNSCFKLKDIKNIKNKNLNKLLSVEGMFQLCIELESLDLSDFDTSNITNMNMMFASCKKLKSIKGINKFNTKKVEIMNAMFQLCYKLEYLDLSNWDTSNVTNMNLMFSQCNKLSTIIGIKSFNTKKVILMEGMFESCNELEY